MDKKRITVEFYSKNGEQKYTGRCVGLLTNTEFNAIVNKPDLQRKLITVRTVPLIDMANLKEIQDLRLAMVTNIGSKEKKGLFITEPIEMVSQFISPDDLTLIGTAGSYITVIEKTGDI